MIKNFLPYFLVVNFNKQKIKKIFRGLLPFGLVKIIQDKNRKKMFTENYLMNNYVSDLTENEKYLLLSYIKLLEKEKKEVS